MCKSGSYSVFVVTVDINMSLLWLACWSSPKGCFNPEIRQPLKMASLLG